MKTQTSRKAIWLRSLLLAPLLGGLLFSFSGRKQIEKDVVPAMVFSSEQKSNNTNPILELKQEPLLLVLNGEQTTLETLKNDFIKATEGNKSDLKIKARGPINYDLIKEIMSVISKDYLLKIQLSEEAYIQDNTDYENEKSQKEATPEQVAEYNKLAKHYNTEIKGNVIIKLKDINRIKKLYNLMSDAQKKNAEPFPNFPPPPTPPKVKKGEASLIPPPPPPAPLRKEEIIGTEAGFIKYMKQTEANKDAIFYNGKEITAKEATAIYKKAGKIDILTQQIGPGEYRVQLSDAKGAATTIKAENLIKSNTQKLSHSQNEVQTAFVNINGSTHYKVIHSGSTNYYNRKGYLTDVNGKVLSNNPVNGDQVIPGQNISQVYKDNKVVVEFKKTGTVENTTSLHLNRKQTLEALKEDRKALLENRKEERKAMLEERKEMLKNRRSQIRSPLYEKFKGMEANGTTFFYEGEKISEAKAIELTKENPKLNVSMQSNNGVSTVHLSKNGIATVNGKLVKQVAGIKKEANPWGLQMRVEEVDSNSKPNLSIDNKKYIKIMDEKGAQFYFGKDKIDLKTAISNVDKYKNLYMSTVKDIDGNIKVIQFKDYESQF